MGHYQLLQPRPIYYGSQSSWHKTRLPSALLYCPAPHFWRCQRSSWCGGRGEGAVLGIARVFLFSAANQPGNVQMRCYVILTSSSLINLFGCMFFHAGHIRPLVCGRFILHLNDLYAHVSSKGRRDTFCRYVSERQVLNGDIKDQQNITVNS